MSDGLSLTRRTPDENDRDNQKRSNAATGASAASTRALASQLVAFYFRAPVKAFFRTRFDYLAYARALNPHAQSGGWTWRQTTPALLASTIREHGWTFIPNQVLPPMLANVAVGALLYTTYLSTLSSLRKPSIDSISHPSLEHLTRPFQAGFVAGAIQSIAAAPIDALSVRYTTGEMIEGKYRSVWQYARQKLREIGPRGIFAGYTLSLVKDTLGCALFFGTFETIKTQGYLSYLHWYYGTQMQKPIGGFWSNALPSGSRPHFALEPTFLLMAGIAASFAQQTVQHPMLQIQNVHYGRLESLDLAARHGSERVNVFRLYLNAYQETFSICRRLAIETGGWRRWLYKDFLWSTLRQVPSTSAGLIVFELLRRQDVFQMKEMGT